jgi:hypothetical protein
MSHKKECTCCGLILNFDCFHKNKNGQYGLHSKCKECKKQYHKNWYLKNKEKRDEQKSIYKKNNKEKIKLQTREYLKKNKGSVSKRQREYYLENRDEILKKCRDRYNVQYKENPAKIASKSRARDVHRANMYSKLSPALKAEVDGIYIFCKIFNGFEVDHIVPIKGEKISGLHSPFNLQAISISENRSKGNRFDDKDLHEESLRLFAHNRKCA